MSYILDALKKSEQERKQGKVPDIQTIHIPVAVEQNTSPWLYVIIVFLLLSLAFVIGWMRPWERHSPVVVADLEQPVPARSASIIEQLPLAEPIIKESSSSVQPEPAQKPQQLAATPRESSVAIEDARKDTPPSLELNTVPHLSLMPDLVQQSIPSMSFAGHIYSSNIAQRSIIINDHSMSEGDTVVEGLEVEQITPNGVVFSYQGQLFKMDILQDWSFD
ncbi:MAG: general secretion pathway protein GspB [Gammaproteobacteria bacterium]|nr:general secretion pathway protein GspB [Gammaproteobacteria bacterium]